MRRRSTAESGHEIHLVETNADPRRRSAFRYVPGRDPVWGVQMERSGA